MVGVPVSLSFILARTTSANAVVPEKGFFSEEWEEGGLSVLSVSPVSLSSSDEYCVIVSAFRRFARRTDVNKRNQNGVHQLR